MHMHCYTSFSLVALPSVHETVAFIKTKYFPVTLKLMATVYSASLTV